MTLKSLKLRDIFQIKQLQVSQFETGSSNFLINRHFHIPANSYILLYYSPNWFPNLSPLPRWKCANVTIIVSIIVIIIVRFCIFEHVESYKIYLISTLICWFRICIDINLKMLVKIFIPFFQSSPVTLASTWTSIRTSKIAMTVLLAHTPWAEVSALRTGTPYHQASPSRRRASACLVISVDRFYTSQPMNCLMKTVPRK